MMQLCMVQPSIIVPGFTLYQIIIENRFYEFLMLHSSTRTSSTVSMIGVIWQFLQAQKKQASSMTSCEIAQLLILHLRSLMYSSSVLKLPRAISVLWLTLWRRQVRNQQWLSTRAAILELLQKLSYSILIMLQVVYKSIYSSPSYINSMEQPSITPRYYHGQPNHSGRRERKPARREREKRRERHRRHSSSSETPRKEKMNRHDRKKRSSSSSSQYSSSVSPETKKRRNTPHYRFHVGERLGHRFKVSRLMGTGAFGRVLQAQFEGQKVAIKIIKPVQKYTSSARIERDIIKALNKADPDDKAHIVRFKQSFYHHRHFCMVFEPLGPSLYDVIKLNRHHGYPRRQVQSFARQLFEAVGFMHSQKYTHTDLKPQNILLCSSQLHNVHHDTFASYRLPSRTEIKLIDFGGATHESQKHSSIINTRQYRAPEVILQCCNWSESSDVWCLGCILTELFTGNLLFATHDDLEHILMIVENSQAELPREMIDNCKNELSAYFTEGRVDQGKANSRITRWEEIVGFKRIDQLLVDDKELLSLVSLCLTVDPAKRISCSSALKHGYFGIETTDIAY